MQISDIRKYGVSAQGRKELIRHLEGKQLTARGAVVAKCYECVNAYSDGKLDCEIPDCPLYPFMPYRDGKKLVLRKMTDEQKIKVTGNLIGKQTINQAA